MEVAAGNDGFIVRENKRIVRDRIQFAFDDRFNIFQRVPHRTMNLRNAAQRVRILHTVVLGSVNDFGALEQFPHMFCHQHLSFLAAGFVDPLVKGVFQAGQGLKIHRSDNIRHPGCPLGII